MKRLRILFTIIAALFVAAVLPVGAVLSWAWAGACGLLAFLFYGLMLLCKQKQEEAEEQSEKSEQCEQKNDNKK